MDDFGSGYSSLNTLKDLLFDEVKIDRKFLGDTLTENARIVLQEVFHMLKRMGKSIVCEGVETQEIADFLQNEAVMRFRDSFITDRCAERILKN